MNYSASKPENPELEQMINETQTNSKLELKEKELTDDDMEFMAYYLQNNDVSNLLLIIKEKNFHIIYLS